MGKQMVHVEDTDADTEIEDVSYIGFESTPVIDDPFLKISF